MWTTNFISYKISCRPISLAKICLLCIIRLSSFAPSYASTSPFVSGSVQLLSSWVLTPALNAMRVFDLNDKMFSKNKGQIHLSGFPALDQHVARTSNPRTRPPGQTLQRTSRQGSTPTKNNSSPNTLAPCQVCASITYHLAGGRVR